MSTTVDSARLIDPPRSAFSLLPTKLTNGEQRVIDLFDKCLPPSWEIYVQPHMNGLRPDIALLNPHVGVALFEIKDWSSTTLRYNVQHSRRGFQRNNPIAKIRLYEDEIRNLYCPRLRGPAAIAVVTVGLVFTNIPHSHAVSQLDPLLDKGMRENRKYYPIAGSDDLEMVDRIFPEGRRRFSKYMTPDLARDLRSWLQDPAFSKQERLRPIPLDRQQRRLVKERAEHGYRRVRGPAGTGKSVVLACRAAELTQLGRSALVVCYNITILNYLRDFSSRYVTSTQRIRKDIVFLNFDRWCKRVCITSDADSHRLIWNDHHEGPTDDQAYLRESLNKVAERVSGLYSEPALPLPTYDAILVDEGQDLDPRWCQILRKALRPGGEMMLVADGTQDIYGTKWRWTDEAMHGCGFRGPWNELKRSYRLPGPVVDLVRRFGEEFLEGADLPVSTSTDEQLEMEELDIDECSLRWVHVYDQESASQVCVDELLRMMRMLPTGTAIADITFLCPSRRVGADVVGRLEAMNIKVSHTFDSDSRISRRQKIALFQGRSNIKATTIHSYKGWEGKLLVVFIDSMGSPKDKALFYTAMTRLRKDQQQSALTIVSSCGRLKGFGRSWPDYDEY